MTERKNDPGEARIDGSTKAEEEREGQSPHDADRAPTAEEEAAAERNRLDPSVSEHEKDMGKRGAEVKGEGEIK